VRSVWGCVACAVFRLHAVHGSLRSPFGEFAATSVLSRRFRSGDLQGIPGEAEVKKFETVWQETVKGFGSLLQRFGVRRVRRRGGV